MSGDLQQRPSHILSARGRRYYWQGAGALSIKTFRGGTAHYRAGNGARYAVEDSTYLILNHGQTYEVEINAAMAVESFCLFFRAGMIEEVRRSLTAAPEALLDEPTGAGRPVHFFERTYTHSNDDSLSLYLYALKRDWDHRPPGGVIDTFVQDEQMHTAALCLLEQHSWVRRELTRLDAVRPATRDELYRRLHHARAYADACFDQAVTLDDLAAIACLSPNHLLRTFPLLFGKTPHQYLTERRLSEARHLLNTTGLSVTAICGRVGFISLGSFSRLFACRHQGLSPTQYRLSQKR